MEKLRDIREINGSLIRKWKTHNIEKILRSARLEEELLLAYENGLYGTPVEPKVNPRELIYAISTIRTFSAAFKKEVKAMTRSWIDMTSATWTDNVPPFYSVELDYILLRI